MKEISNLLFTSRATVTPYSNALYFEDLLAPVELPSFPGEPVPQPHCPVIIDKEKTLPMKQMVSSLLPKLIES